MYLSVESVDKGKGILKGNVTFPDIMYLPQTIDNEKRKVICSLKQLKENPWLKLKENYKINDSFETEVVNIVDFGIFVKVHDEIDGMIHISDLDWNEKECSKMLEKFNILELLRSGKMAMISGNEKKHQPKLIKSNPYWVEGESNK